MPAPINPCTSGIMRASQRGSMAHARRNNQGFTPSVGLACTVVPVGEIVGGE